VRLALKFSEALGATVTVVAYAEFENVIEVDRDRNVVFDFGIWIPWTLNVSCDTAWETSMVYLASTRCLPCRVCWSVTPILRACRVDIGSVYMLKMGVVNISTLSVDDQTRFSNAIWTVTVRLGYSMTVNCKVLPVNFVDITVYISA